MCRLDISSARRRLICGVAGLSLLGLVSQVSSGPIAKALLQSAAAAELLLDCSSDTTGLCKAITNECVKFPAQCLTPGEVVKPMPTPPDPTPAIKADPKLAAMTVAEVFKAARYGIGRIVIRTAVVLPSRETAVYTGTGTGFLVDASGNMATNCHVVRAPDGAKATGPTTIEVVFPDRPDARFPATVTGCDDLGDIAVIKVAGVGAWRSPLRFADPKGIEVGQEAITVGFAEGIAGEPTVSRGIVSALHRSVEGGSFSDLVQTDATINHGNSGGPLLNLRGEVIGVNTYTSALSVKVSDLNDASAKKSETVQVSTTGTNMYFARSAASASRYVQAVLTSGRVNRASFGVTVGTIKKTLTVPRAGVAVRDVAPDGQARNAFKSGDIVTAFVWSNGYTYAMVDLGSWNDALAMVQPGQSVTVQFYRLTDRGWQAVLDYKDVPATEIQWLKVTLTATKDSVQKVAAPNAGSKAVQDFRQ